MYGYWTHLKGDQMVARISVTRKEYATRKVQAYIKRAQLTVSSRYGENTCDAYYLDDGTAITFWWDPRHLDRKFTKSDDFVSL